MRWIVLAGFSLYVAAVTAAIEYYNARGGYPFPNREYRDGDPALGPVKMRHNVFPTERGYARNRVMNLVESVGLLQYIFAPLLIGLAWVSRKDAKGFVMLPWVAIAIGVIACASIYYRAYFTSLGW